MSQGRAFVTGLKLSIAFNVRILDDITKLFYIMTFPASPSFILNLQLVDDQNLLSISKFGR